MNEDLWVQLLDFSNQIHENLSNFDKNGAWPWLLDDFVDHLKAARTSHRVSPHFLARHDTMETSDCSSSPRNNHQISINLTPRCGSKRRSDDLDSVTEQLLAMPLSSGEPSSQDSKRQCVAEAQGFHLDNIMGQLPLVQTRSKRSRGTRRSGSSASVKELVNQTVSEALGIQES